MSPTANITRRWWTTVTFTVGFFGPRIAHLVWRVAVFLVPVCVVMEVLEYSTRWARRLASLSSEATERVLVVLAVYLATSSVLTFFAVMLDSVHLTRTATATVGLTFFALEVTCASFGWIHPLSFLGIVGSGVTATYVLRRVRPWKNESWNGRPIVRAEGSNTMSHA